MSALAGVFAAGAVLCGAWAGRLTVRARLRERVGVAPAGATAATLRRPRDPRIVLWPLAGGALGLLSGGVVRGALGVVVVLAGRRLRAARGARALGAQRDEQLADAVGAIASAMRAGMSVPQSLAYAAQEASAPLSDDLGRLVAEVDVGVPLAEAVSLWVERVGTDDARLLGGAFELHRRTGGDLPKVLDQVGATIRERVAAAREVRALTAQARLSGLILGLLPVGFFAFLWLTSRDDIEGALGTPAGAVSVALGLVMEGLAFVWIRRLLEVA